MENTAGTRSSAVRTISMVIAVLCGLFLTLMGYLLGALGSFVTHPPTFFLWWFLLLLPLPIVILSFRFRKTAAWLSWLTFAASFVNGIDMGWHFYSSATPGEIMRAFWRSDWWLVIFFVMACCLTIRAT
jgi:hypothetical protein